MSMKCSKCKSRVYPAYLVLDGGMKIRVAFCWQCETIFRIGMSAHKIKDYSRIPTIACFNRDCAHHYYHLPGNCERPDSILRCPNRLTTDPK